MCVCMYVCMHIYLLLVIVVRVKNAYKLYDAMVGYRFKKYDIL